MFQYYLHAGFETLLNRILEVANQRAQTAAQIKDVETLGLCTQEIRALKSCNLDKTCLGFLVSNEGNNITVVYRDPVKFTN